VRPQALALPSLVESPVAEDEAQSLARVRERNEELRARQLEADAVAAELRSRAGRHWPRLELELAHARNRNLGGLPGQVQDTRGFAVITWPLLSGGIDLANQRAAAARLTDAQARWRSAERRIVQEVETIHSNWAANSERLEAVRAELAGNQRLVATLKRQVESARAGNSITDLLDAMQRDAQSRVDLVQALVARTQLGWRLAQLKGELAVVFGADR
jgi:outer membrane protein TolC